jgi:hypothetical protein
MRTDEIRKACRMHAREVLTEKSEGKKPLARPKHRWTL